jgi:hypothetical protein
MTAKSKSRVWIRFGLRTLILLMSIVALGTWWVTAQLRWIHERHKFLLSRDANSTVSAPWPLWLFREYGADEVYVRVINPIAREHVERIWPDELSAEESAQFLGPGDIAEMERARQLFPEARTVRPGFFSYKSWDD